MDENNNMFENQINDNPAEAQPAAPEISDEQQVQQPEVQEPVITQPEPQPEPQEQIPQPAPQPAQPYQPQQEIQYTPCATPIIPENQPVQEQPVYSNGTVISPPAPEKKKKNGAKIFGFVLLGALATALTVLVIYGVLGIFKSVSSIMNNNTDSPFFPFISSEDTPSSEQEQIETKSGFELETRENSEALTPSEIAAKVRPSVVGVVNYSINSLTPSGYGSGVIINKDGYIVTNYHVIKAADRIKIVLDNQKEVLAKIIGYDEQTDLAVLKIIEDDNVKNSDLTYATFGDSDQIQLAETVIAIGNPGGLEFAGTVTRGIVSGTNVKADASGTVGFIQTDAAINPGNSGGPLIDSYGNVIGITSEKIVATEYEGMGFAIPSNIVKPITDSIITYGYVPGRPLLGISGSDIDEYVAYFNRVPQGVLITDIDPNSDLYAKGVTKNDIITEFNGVVVKTMEELNAEKEKCKAGDTVELKIYRYSEAREFTVKVVLSEYKPN